VSIREPFQVCSQGACSHGLQGTLSEKASPESIAAHKTAGKAPQQPASRTRWRPALPDNLAFLCDPEDHCETAPEAYRDVKPLLLQLCRLLGTDAGALQIYDPYYCAGSAVKHLADLGFPRVHNKCVLHIPALYHLSVVEGGSLGVSTVSAPPQDLIVTFSGT
jgi:hypothetical protein